MSMLKKLKGLFIKESNDQTDLPMTDDSSNLPPDTSNMPPATIKLDLSVDTADKANLIAQVQPVTNTPQPGVVTDKYVDMVLEALEKNNLPSFDYLEFRHIVRLSETSNVDEKTRFESALTYAKSMGKTAAQLMEDAKHYVQIIDREVQQFDQTVLQQITTEVGGIEQKMQEILDGIAAKEAKILALQAEIQQEQQVVDALKLQAAQTVGDIDTQKNHFKVSSEAIQLQILEDMQKIQNYSL